MPISVSMPNWMIGDALLFAEDIILNLTHA